MTRRILLLDNGLQNRTGHHYTMDWDFKEILTARGFDCRIWVHRHASDEVLRRFAARPVFHNAPFDSFSRDPLAGPIRSMFLGGHRFMLDLREAMADEPIGPDDIVFLPFVLRNELQGMALWLSGLPADARPRVLMNIGFDDSLEGRDGTPDPLKLAALRLLGFRLSDAFQEPGLILTTCGQRNAGFFSETLTYPVRDYPLAHTYAGRRPKRGNAAERDRTIKVSVFGHTQKRKGFHLLPEIIRTASAANANLSFFIQVDPPDAIDSWGDAGDLLNSDRVELHNGSLETDDDFDRLEASDIVLMPYDPSYYVGCTSGVFAESVAFGKVCIVPKGTWKHEQLEHGRGVGGAIDQYGAASAARVLLTVAEQIVPLSQIAQTKTEPWRSHHNTGNFVDRMLSDIAGG